MKTRHIIQISILIAITMLLAAPGYAGYAGYETALIASLGLDEAFGATTAVDSSANNNDGTITAATPGVSGATSYSGTAYDFDGENDWVGIDMDIPTSSFTLLAWVDLDTITDNRSILAQDSTVDGSPAIRLYVSAGTLAGKIRDSGGNKYVTGDSISTDNWRHVALTFNGSEMQLYLDGAVSGSSGSAGPPIINTADNVTIGIYEYSAGHIEDFDGTIDEVAIMGRALAYDATNGGEIGAVKNFGVHMFAGVTGGIEDIETTEGFLGYTADELYQLVQLYDNAATGVPLSIGSETWYYTDAVLGGSYGDGWVDNGDYYIDLGSGLTTSTDSIPEPASVLFALAGLGLAIKRKFHR